MQLKRFANALHAPWWSGLTAADTKHPELIKKRCEEEIRSDQERYGFSQLLGLGIRLGLTSKGLFSFTFFIVSLSE